MPGTLVKRANYTLLEPCLAQCATQARAPQDPNHALTSWQQWQQRMIGTQASAHFILGFRLTEPPAQAQPWQLDFIAIASQDSTQQLLLADYWQAKPTKRTKLTQAFGEQFEQHILRALGHAAHMVPALWAAMDNAEPAYLALDEQGVLTFLQESLWLLEDAGFKVIVPSWWTPQGRRRVRLRLRQTGQKSTPQGAATGGSGLQLGNLIEYQYQLAIGDKTVSAQEWEQLVKSKTPLVKFRGEWMMLDQNAMGELLKFWHEHKNQGETLSIEQVLQRSSGGHTIDISVDHDSALGEMLERLRDPRRIEIIDTPASLEAQLRDYQKRGVAWIALLEQLHLNGCLADDMGLGKTMQVIARLLQERATSAQVGTTLLIAPTSVLGNWEKEIARFAPSLSTWLHHGPEREKAAKTFARKAAKHDVVLTSYALARMDEKLLIAVDWHRVVLDEAQNIKNPKAGQTRAVLKLSASHRLALTGTPAENRLMDLWSIINFANPGYLDTQAQFRKRFEIPVQRDQDPQQSAVLKRLVEPLILRRLKTDKTIIADLPDKLEALQYCNLSREQAALYEAVVREVERKLEDSEGIARQGLMLSTLMRLKQICNHPAQYLQDNSDFTIARSHKLERLTAMLEEVQAAGDSVLIFSQFTKLAERLEWVLRRATGFRTFYLHGGTSRKRRQQMIGTFQDPQSEPAIFVLSLQAGGTSITLTRANHVFHFDRWWNPAVEDQASDRAYRIGQEKTVFVHKFVTLGTVEERISTMIDDKKALANVVVGSGESWLSELDNERFKALIELNRAAVMP